MNQRTHNLIYWGLVCIVLAWFAVACVQIAAKAHLMEVEKSCQGLTLADGVAWDWCKPVAR